MEAKNLKGILALDVVVPEIQREYVWGGNKRVLTQFISDLKTKKELNVGFVYSYQPYPNLNEIFLIDGQQRITTLILIAFYCAIKEENKLKEFKLLLRMDKTKPAFSYRVRSCTKDFMIKLFDNIDNPNDLRNIRNQKWYLASYETDMTIASMIKAIDVIDENLKDSVGLYDYIVENVKFWYFNVGDTSQGEELYITMNNRGESLTEAEQIKPLLFEKVESSEKHKFGKLWDEIEEYFYALKPVEKGIEIVDTMMNRFIQLILQLENQTEKSIGGSTRFTPEEIQKIDFQKIEIYYKALKLIESNFKEKREISLLSCLYEESQEQKYLFPLAALMKAVYVYIYKSNNPALICLEDNQQQELTRLYQIVRNAVRRGSLKYVPLLNLMFLYDESKTIYEFFIDNHNPTNKENHILSPHELEKVKIIFNSESIEKTEKAFWEAQEQLEYLLSGSLKPLISPFASDEKWTDLILAKFNKRKWIVSEIFNRKNIKIKLSEEHVKGIIDNGLIARALLIFGDYAKIIGGDNWCFGYDKYWNIIFKEDKGSDVLSKLISKLAELNNDSLYDNIQSLIKFYIDNYRLESKDSRYYFVKHQNAFRAIGDGYNVITFWGSWKDYRIEVLNKERLSSYHINPFLNAVSYKLDKNERKDYLKCNIGDDYSSIVLKNGITITCGSNHAWFVKSDKLSLHIEYLIWNEDKKQYTYTVDLSDDLIEKGVELFYKLEDL